MQCGLQPGVGHLAADAPLLPCLAVLCQTPPSMHQHRARYFIARGWVGLGGGEVVVVGRLEVEGEGFTLQRSSVQYLRLQAVAAWQRHVYMF